MQRHVRVHSGVKPYRCSHLGCEKHFSRVDSLTRHLKMHDRETDNPTYGGSDLAQTIITPSSDSQHIIGAIPTPLEEEHHIDLATLNSLDTLTDDAAGVGPMASSSWPDFDALFAILTSNTHIADRSQPDMSHDSRFDADVSGRNGQQHIAGPFDHARRAVQSLSSLLQEFSSDLARDVEGTGVTPDFLDACLGCFFQHFHPIFPVIHEPTFAVRDCTPTLLLTMIALGSLFLATDGATSKGEALWKIAHAAIATSWQSLLAYSAPNETAPGKQLVLTSLLGQAYAVLSVNGSLRLTSQALRGLGFYWTRQTVGSVDALRHTRASWHDESLETSRRWRIWAEEEVQRRAVLWHYVLDGLISQSSGLPNGIRHTINDIALPCSDAAFEAGTAEDWLSLIAHESQSTSTTCRELLLQLFALEAPPPQALWSHTSIPVVMEALQSLITETREAGGPSVGLPSRSDISQALWRLFDSQIKHELQATVSALDLSIRWHVICIGLCADPVSLLQDLRCREAAKQDHHSGNTMMSHDTPSLTEWQRSHLARRALLHATAVIQLMQRLPLGNMDALHIPLSLNILGTIVLAADSIDGTSKIRLPETICWKSVCDLNSNVQDSCTPTTFFIHHGSVPPNCRTRTQNYTVLLNALHSIRASRTSTWGITGGLESVDQLLRARLQRA